jgi:hypothetical protein
MFAYRILGGRGQFEAGLGGEAEAEAKEWQSKQGRSSG